MLSFINLIVDRCLFTVTFLLGVQLPEFINQYSQQLSGHLNEANRQLMQFKQLAELHHNGELPLLIRAYKTNSDPSVVDTASIIEQLLLRIEYLEQHLHSMLNPLYWQRIQHLLIEGDLAIMQQTAKIFTLAIPLELAALITGLAVAMFFMMLSSFFRWLLARLFNTEPAYR